MISQKEYWDKQIKDWTKISYEKKTKGMGLVERMANLFRGPITKRMDVALEIVGPKAKDKIILDMGCGLGDFCFEILKYQPKKVIGLDISSVAVKEAQKKAKSERVEKKVKFIQENVTQMKKLPQFDIAVGLGFIDYLDEKEMKRLFKLLNGGHFLFSVFEKKFSLINLIHEFYVRIKDCPGAYKFTRKETNQLAPKKLKLRFLKKEKMLFITNLIEKK